MKKIIVLIVMLYSSILVQGQNNYSYIEHNVRLENNLLIPTMTLYHEKSFGDSKWGYTDYIYVTQDWGEVLPGVYYKANDKLLVAGYVGVESIKPYVRFGSYVAYNFNDKIKVSAFAEKGIGSDNYWYDIQLPILIRQSSRGGNWSIVPRIRREHGLGTVLMRSVKIQDWRINLSPAIFYHINDKVFKPTVFVALEF